MDNSIYVSLSRQMAMFRHMDVTANNVANAATTGFQAENTMFTDYLTEDGNRQKIAFTQDIATYHDLSQGTLRKTGNPLDVAIAGEGYFVVQTPAGERYTRAGNFQVDGNNQLVTVEGYPVLDDGGQPIQFDQQDIDIRIGDNGTIFAKQAINIQQQERGRLGVVEFPNRQELRRAAGTLYESDVPGAPAVNSRVLHGMLENSNVKPVNELVRMTRLSRSTGDTSKFIETMYDLQRKASNTWTKQG